MYISLTGNTQQTTTSKQPFHCNTMGNYKYLHSDKADLCVHIITNRLNFEDARISCNQEGGDLVILDTYEKSLLLRNELHGNIHSLTFNLLIMIVKLLKTVWNQTRRWVTRRLVRFQAVCHSANMSSEF